MDAALQGLAWETCMPYLDDAGIWSTGHGDTPEERENASFEQMMQLEHVRNVFEFHVEADPGPAPATGGVRLKPVLCTILTTPVKYDKMASSTDDAYRRVRDTGPIAQIT